MTSCLRQSLACDAGILASLDYTDARAPAWGALGVFVPAALGFSLRSTTCVLARPTARSRVFLPAALEFSLRSMTLILARPAARSRGFLPAALEFSLASLADSPLAAARPRPTPSKSYSRPASPPSPDYSSPSPSTHAQPPTTPASASIRRPARGPCRRMNHRARTRALRATSAVLRHRSRR